MECLGQILLGEEIPSFQVTDEDEPNLGTHTAPDCHKAQHSHVCSHSLHDHHHDLDCGLDHESPKGELSLVAHWVGPSPSCMAQVDHIVSLGEEGSRPASRVWCCTRSYRSLVDLDSLACLVERCWEEYWQA